MDEVHTTAEFKVTDAEDNDIETVRLKLEIGTSGDVPELRCCWRIVSDVWDDTDLEELAVPAEHEIRWARRWLEINREGIEAMTQAAAWEA